MMTTIQTVEIINKTAIIKTTIIKNELQTNINNNTPSNTNIKTKHTIANILSTSITAPNITIKI